MAARSAELREATRARRTQDRLIERRTMELYKAWVAEATVEAGGDVERINRASLVEAMRIAEQQATREVLAKSKPTAGKVW
jgi:hypothetical protein